tara:strand:+ start:38 stop:571 length:534 start_codon:yes stop_codon:yes gene_type:complete
MMIYKKSEAVNVLLNQEILCMFDGAYSEIGPRALGKRSMLFDPRNKNGKQIVNTIKKRENYRPFAGVVMHEHAKLWFEMGNIKESPFMLYAIPVQEDRKKLIPSIVHVDGTCRIQTVTKEQNLHLYELLESFAEKTNVPILLNTSLNLAGKPLISDITWAKKLIERSSLKHLYFPGT